MRATTRNVEADLPLRVSSDCRAIVGSVRRRGQLPPQRFDGGGPMAVIIRDRASARLTAARVPAGNGRESTALREAERARTSDRLSLPRSRAAGFWRLPHRRRQSAPSAASPGPRSAAPPIGRWSRTASSPATSRSIPPWCGRAPTGPRACWSRSRPPTASRPFATPSRSTRLPRSTSPPRRCSKDCRPDRTSSIASGSRTIRFPTVVSEPQVGRFRTAPSERRSVSFVWSGDTAGQGWGIDEARGGMRTYATMARSRPDFFIHSGDHIYADCPVAAECELAERRDLEKPRHRGEVEDRPDARGVPRQLQIQSARSQPARVQRRGADVRAMGRSRGHQRLVPGGAARPRRLRRPQHPRARGARLPRLPRVHADAPDTGRGRTHLSPGALRPAARRVHARHALLPRRGRRGWRGSRDPRADAGRLAQARTRRLAGALEGDRRRPSDRSGERRCDRARRRPRARPRDRDRRSALLHEPRRHRATPCG